MTYDDISSEISKLKSQLSQRKSQFSEAKIDVEELKSVFTNFDNNKLAYDNKDYQKAISLFDSGDYQKAQSLSKQAIQAGQSTFSAMEDAKKSIDHLESIISHLESIKVKYDKKAYNSAVSDFESGDYLITQSTADLAIKDAEGSLSAWKEALDVHTNCQIEFRSAVDRHGLNYDKAHLSKLEKDFEEGNYEEMIKNGRKVEKELTQLIESHLQAEAVQRGKEEQERELRRQNRINKNEREAKFKNMRSALQTLVESCGKKRDPRDHGASLSKIDSAAKSEDYLVAISSLQRLSNKLAKDIKYFDGCNKQLSELKLQIKGAGKCIDDSPHISV